VVHEQVFAFVLGLAEKKGLLKGKTVATDSTFLEANAAMKTIERKDSGEDYKAYLKRLAQEAGLEDPSDEELRRFDRNRPGKKVSNQEWQSATDADSRIAKMKDGTTHLAYKAEQSWTWIRTWCCGGSLSRRPRRCRHVGGQCGHGAAQRAAAGSEAAIEEVAADKAITRPRRWRTARRRAGGRTFPNRSDIRVGRARQAGRARAGFPSESASSARPAEQALAAATQRVCRTQFCSCV